MTSNGGSSEARTERAVRDAYGVALAALLGAVLMLIASGTPILHPVALVAALLQVAALMLTLRVSGVNRRWLNGLSVTVLLLFGGLVTSAYLGGKAGLLVTQLGWLALTVATMVAILRRLRAYDQVTLQLVLGLLCVYLLIGMSFGLAYVVAETLDPAAFVQGIQGASGSMYFSFITLATVGYGDITPANPVVRSLTVAEAILGQLYLVSIVSLAVSRLGRRPHGAEITKENL